jgi:hypothetical protein
MLKLGKEHPGNERPEEAEKAEQRDEPEHC